MQFLMVLLASISCIATAAPHPLGPGTLAYFSLLGQRLQVLQEKISKKTENQDPIASCNNFDLSTAQFPSLPSGLPAPSGTPYHVAIGRGSQNYTCAAYSANPSAIPVQIGAAASLFNISCGATIAPTQTSALPPAVIEHPFTSSPDDPLFPGGPTTSISGYHYFTDTTPTFNLNLDSTQYGITFTKVATKVPAPVNALTNGFWPYSDSNDSETPVYVRNTTAVPWLKLTAQTAPAVSEEIVSENKGGVVEVYRVNTAGGSPPKDCSKFPDGGHFELPYAAEYWFFS